LDGPPFMLDADQVTQGARSRGWARVQVADDLTVTTFDNRWSVGEAHYLYHEIFTHDDYLVGLSPLRPGSVVVDAGANIGLFALRVGLACPGLRLIALEPAPDTCALLRHNLAAAGLDDVEVRQVALGERAGSAILTVFRHLPANSTTRPDQKPAQWTASMRSLEPEQADAMLETESVEVAVVRLSDVLPADIAAIDLLKIDVEGAELDVLRGLADADWPLVAHVVVEVHDVDGRLADVLGLLRDRGFVCDVRVPAMMPSDLDHHIVTARRP
jgi:FkbM family methyltransferase